MREFPPLKRKEPKGWLSPQNICQRPLHFRRLSEKLFRCANPSCGQIAISRYYPCCSPDCMVALAVALKTYLKLDLGEKAVSILRQAKPTVNEFSLARALSVQPKYIRKLCRDTKLEAEATDTTGAKNPQWRISSQSAAQYLLQCWFVVQPGDLFDLLGFSSTRRLREFRANGGFAVLEKRGYIQSVRTPKGLWGLWIFDITPELAEQIGKIRQNIKAVARFEGILNDINEPPRRK